MATLFYKLIYFHSFQKYDGLVYFKSTDGVYCKFLIKVT